MSVMATRPPSALRAEALRWKGSLPHHLVYVVAVYGLLVTAMFLAGPMERSWEGLFAWHNVWAVTVGPLYAVLLGSAVTGMDQRNRGGGTWWRRVDPTKARAARVVVLVAHVLAANLLAVVIPVALAGPLGLGGGAPWARAVLLAAVCGLSQSALAVLAVLLSRLLHPVVALFVGVAFALSWMFAGTVETDRWMSWPANWLVRGTIPLTRTHANGVGLEPGSPLAEISIWAPAALSLALAVVLSSVEPTPLATTVDRLRQRRYLAAHRGETASRTQPTAVTTATTVASPTSGGSDPARQTAARAGLTVAPERAHPSRPRPVRAMLAVVGRTWVPWGIAALVAVGLAFLRWRPADDVAQLLAVVLVPTAASVLPLAVWSVLAPGWRGVAGRSTRSLRPITVVVLASIGYLVVLVAVVLGGLTLRGLDPGLALRVLRNCAVVAAFVVPTVLWLATRFGTTVAGSLSLFGIVFGVLIGGTGLMDTLWPLMPWAWGGLSGTLRVALAMGVTVLVAPALTRLAATATLRGASAD